MSRLIFVPTTPTFLVVVLYYLKYTIYILLRYQPPNYKYILPLRLVDLILLTAPTYQPKFLKNVNATTAGEITQNGSTYKTQYCCTQTNFALLKKILPYTNLEQIDCSIPLFFFFQFKPHPRLFFLRYSQYMEPRYIQKQQENSITTGNSQPKNKMGFVYRFASL